MNEIIDTTKPPELEIRAVFPEPIAIAIESASIEFPGGLTAEEAARIEALIEQIEDDD